MGQEGFYFLQEGLDFDILAVQDSKLVEISLEDASVHERLIWLLIIWSIYAVGGIIFLIVHNRRKR